MYYALFFLGTSKYTKSTFPHNFQEYLSIKMTIGHFWTSGKFRLLEVNNVDRYWVQRKNSACVSNCHSSSSNKQVTGT